MPAPHIVRTSMPSDAALPRVVVAMPVRNEIDHIAACLRALDSQVGAAPDRVVLLLNGCTDGTDACVRDLAPSLAVPLQIIERNLRGNQATAGFARSLAMRYAAAPLDGHDVVMTTDADAIVTPDWIAGNLTALRRGADAVCGRALLNPADALVIPAHLHEDDARECRLVRLLDEIASLLDPEPHDPWPRHTENSGASIAVTVAALRRAGGMPPVPCGEDRAFIARLRQIDLRVRHAVNITVTVSGRTEGRAVGGMADTIRRRMIQQDEFADEALEPAADRNRRVLARAALRAFWLNSSRTYDDFAQQLDVPARRFRAAVAAPFFGQAWAMLQRASPLLRANRVRFAALASEIKIAEQLRDAAYDIAAGDAGEPARVSA